MGKKASSPPPAPDPYATADAQGEMNQDFAEYNAALNRINTYTPWGSQTYNVTGTDPRTGAPLYEQNINLSPEQQQLLDAQMQQNLQLTDLGGTVIDHLTGEPIDTSGLPALQGAFDLGGPGVQSGYQKYDPRFSLNTAGLPNVGSDIDLQGQYQQYAPQLGLDTAGLPGLPGANDLAAFRDEAEGALYDRNTAYLDDQYGRDENSLRTRLANQGIVEGTEAYTNAIGDFNRGKEMAYRQARNESIAGGGAEAERMNRIGASNRGQLYDEILSGGMFGNSAAGQATDQAARAAAFGNATRGQDIGEDLATRGMMFGEEMAGGQFANDAYARATAQNADAANFSNLSRNQMLAEMLARGGFQNDARAQGLQEELALRNQPLNEFNAYRTGSQVNLPQFDSTYRSAANPADLQGAVYNSYQNQLDLYNAQQSGANSLMGGLFGLGAAALGNPSFALSDERAKDNIEHIGELDDGTGLYSYTYKGDTAPQVGVMAQEVERGDPSAVKTGRDGFKRVNYAKVLANQLEFA